MAQYHELGYATVEGVFTPEQTRELQAVTDHFIELGAVATSRLLYLKFCALVRVHHFARSRCQQLLGSHASHVTQGSGLFCLCHSAALWLRKQCERFGARS